MSCIIVLLLLVFGYAANGIKVDEALRIAGCLVNCKEVRKIINKLKEKNYI